MNFRVFNLQSDPSRDVISLETNRRVSAVLHCNEGCDLLLLNGGSEPEHLHVDVVVPAVREPHCFGSYTIEPGKFVIVPLERPSRSVHLRVRIVGGPEPIVLGERPGAFSVPVSRLATAAAILLGLSALLTLPYDREVAVRPHAVPSYRVAAAPHAKPRTPRVAHVAPRPIHHAPPLRTAIYTPPRPAVPPPIVAVSTPAHVFKNQPVGVAFRTTGEQVRIVAKIGPRTVADRIIGASQGKIFLQGLPPSRDVRVLTISTYASGDHRTSSRIAIVILLPDSAPTPLPPATNL